MFYLPHTHGLYLRIKQLLVILITMCQTVCLNTAQFSEGNTTLLSYIGFSLLSQQLTASLSPEQST